MGVPGQSVHGDKNMFCVSFRPCCPWKCRRPDRPVYTAGQARQNLRPPAEVPVTCQFRLPFRIKRNCRQQYTILKTDVQSVCLFYLKIPVSGGIGVPYSGLGKHPFHKCHGSKTSVMCASILYCLYPGARLINSMYLLYRDL